MITKEIVISRATDSLERFPYLRSRIDDRTVIRCVETAWPEPPAPLVFLLFVAGTNLDGKQSAEQVLASVEAILTLLTRTDAVSGAWRSRLNRVLPPRMGGTFEDHYVNFQSALFELVLAFRLVTAETNVKMNGEHNTSVCDLDIDLMGEKLFAVEAYAPRKGAELWYQDGVLTPWRGLVTGGAVAAARDIERPRDMTIDPDAVVRALRDALTTTNFDQKRKQLASGEVPTLLAIRGYGLTRELHELSVLTPPLDIARRVGQEAWNRLPNRCLGVLLSLLGDVLKLDGPTSPAAFIPAPGRRVTQRAWAFLDRSQMLASDVQAQRESLVES